MSMTESEALEKLKLEGGLEIGGKPKRVAEFFEALFVAEEALKEIQQYRAIGTVEELKTMKENGAFSAFEMAQLIAKMNKLKEYEAIGTVSEFRELKEKATAKKPIDVRYFAEAGYSIGLCPTCKSGINSEFKYCGDCCQCLDWSEGKE